jgi:hypothetical protein
MDWTDRQAETIVDAFLAYRGTNDLLRCNGQLLRRSAGPKEVGQAGKSPEIMMLFRENG